MSLRRSTSDRSHNGTVALDEKTKNPEFTIRESPLTVLIAHSLHIRAIYHIFVVILLILLCDTVIYDLIERGKQVKIILNKCTAVNYFSSYWKIILYPYTSSTLKYAKQ